MAAGAPNKATALELASPLINSFLDKVKIQIAEGLVDSSFSRIKDNYQTEVLKAKY